MKKVIPVLCFITCFAGADETYVYPTKGQSMDQQKQDKYECYQWAAEQSGFDPAADHAVVVSEKPDTDTTSGGGGVTRSALGGATKGVVIAEVSDGDTGKAAATGAAMGIRKGKRQKRQQQAAEDAQRKEAEQARAEAEARQQQLRANYERANAACLEGRGYTVK